MRLYTKWTIRSIHCSFKWTMVHVDHGYIIDIENGEYIIIIIIEYNIHLKLYYVPIRFILNTHWQNPFISIFSITTLSSFKSSNSHWRAILYTHFCNVEIILIPISIVCVCYIRMMTIRPWTIELRTYETFLDLNQTNKYSYLIEHHSISVQNRLWSCSSRSNIVTLIHVVLLYTVLM